MMFKRIISAICAAVVMISITSAAVCAEDDIQSPASDYFIYNIDTSNITEEEYNLLMIYSGYSLDEITGFEEVSGKILYLSTKQNFEFSKRTFSDDGLKNFKSSVKTNYEFMQRTKNSELYGFMYDLYLQYISYIDASDLSEFTSFYTFANSNATYQKLCTADELFRTYIMAPVLDEYCYSINTVSAVNNAAEGISGTEEYMALLVSVLKTNSEREDIPLSVKDLYAMLYTHYNGIQNGAYKTDVISLLTYQLYDIKGRNAICEEINKYSEFNYFVEYCEKFRYCATMDTMSRIKQTDALEIIEKLSNNNTHYKENIRLKEMYYNLLCNNVYYQNKSYKKADLQTELENFKNKKTAMSVYFNDIYNNYNNVLFTEANVTASISDYNSRVKAFCPKAQKNELYEYSSQVESDGTAYNPIKIQGDNMVVVYLITGIVIFILVVLILAGVKVAIKKIKEIPKVW